MEEGKGEVGEFGNGGGERVCVCIFWSILIGEFWGGVQLYIFE